MNIPYTFTDDDLWAYLSTKRDDEIVGYCGSPATCLIAQAIQAKYPDLVGKVEVSGDFERALLCLRDAGVTVPLTVFLGNVLYVFDWLTGKNWGCFEPVTKAEFMQAWQVYQAQ